MPKKTSHLVGRRSSASNAEKQRRSGVAEIMERTKPARSNPRTLSSAALIGRSEAARRAGVSTSTLRRWEKQEIVHPVVDENGHHFFDPTELDAVRLKIKRTTTAAPLDPGAVDGAMAARVFSMLSSGKDAVEIVCELQLHPNAVEVLLHQFARLRGGFFVDRPDAEEIGKSLSLHFGPKGAVARAAAPAASITT